MKKLLLLLLLANLTSYGQNLTGAWQFSSITDSLQNPIEDICKDDVMFLNKDSSFSYSFAIPFHLPLF